MSTEQNTPPSSEAPNSDKSLKGRLVRMAKSFWITLQPIINRYQPIFEKYWGKFEALIERVFALSDHSSLRTPRIMLRVCVFMLVIFFLWALLFKIDQVVHAQGQVIASSHTQIVQAADGGILVNMKVQEGDEVAAGQIIAVLEKDRALASYTESQGKVMALRMTVARLQAEITNKPLEYDASLMKSYPQLVETQMNLYKQRRKAIEDQLLVLKDNIKLAKQELAMNEPLEKMGDISKGEGRTVLFVSHNMAAVKSLCDKGIVLENGKTSFNGPVDGAIEYYLKNSESFAHRRWDAKTSPKVNFIRLLEAKVLNIHNEIALNHPITDDVNIEFTYEVTQENQLFLHGFNLFNGHNIHILSSHDKQAKSLNNPLPLGIHSTNITIPGNFLAEGEYNCSFAIMRYNPFHVEFHEMEVVGFNIIDEIGGNTVRGNYTGKFPGLVRPLLNWK